ncbi:hypothetical protein HZS_3872 [Henneguya salminicola]|nr:hypothetical protein HZS_3872 [Henneguya salminicola]
MEKQSKIFYDGFNYTIVKSTKNNHFYRCTASRSHNARKIHVRGEDHSFKSLAQLNEHIIDGKDEMKEKASKIAKENLDKSARMIWNEINVEIDKKYQSKYKTIIKLPRKEVLNIFATIGKDLQPSKIISKINDPKIAGIGRSDDCLFFNSISILKFAKQD